MRQGAYWAAITFASFCVMMASLFLPGHVDAIRYKLGIIDDRPVILDTMRLVNGRIDTSTPAGSPVFLGDSITMAMPAATIEPGAVNFAIGGQSSGELLEEAERLSSVKSASALYIMVGTNDVLRDKTNGIEDRYRRIIKLVPPSVPVVMTSPPPSVKISAGGLTYVARAANRACSAAANCHFIDLHRALMDGGKIREGVLLPDGIHLSPIGVNIWRGLLREAIPPLPTSDVGSPSPTPEPKQ